MPTTTTSTFPTTYYIERTIPSTGVTYAAGFYADHRDAGLQAQAYELRLAGESYAAIATTLGFQCYRQAKQACDAQARRCGTDAHHAYRRTGALIAAARLNWLPATTPMTDDVTFAVEIEVSRGVDVTQARNLLATNTDPVTGETWTTRGWKAVSDGSVPYGCEVKPGILRGEAGLAEAMAVAELLRANGGTIEANAGLHVHVGTSTLTPAQIERIIDWSVRSQNVLDWLVAPSRRGNGFAKPMNAAAARTAKALLHRRTIVQGHYDQRRYQALNLCAFQYHGTLEFRQHEGSLSGQQISTWVRFLVAVVDAASRDALVVPRSRFVSVEAMLTGLPVRRLTAEALIRRAERHNAPAPIVARAA